MNEHLRSTDPNVLLGLDAPDDAAVYRISSDQALVQTVDFFTPIVDDPYEWGEIAAANSFSDIYAMGAKPLLALNLVGWPKELDFELLARVLEGGADKAAEAGVSIIGGHTVDDPEPKYGMSVTGIVRPEKVIRISGARAGDSVVLTKPLSMGIVSTAIKQGKVDPALAAEATKVMSVLNASAAEAMSTVAPHAATDVTGFGVAGHLHQMARTSGLHAQLWFSEIPVLAGVEALAEQGLIPGGTRRNESHFGEFVSVDESLSPARRTIIFDAQTSGGLLIAVAPDRVSELIGTLKAAGTPAAHEIGEFVEGNPGSITLRAER